LLDRTANYVKIAINFKGPAVTQTDECMKNKQTKTKKKKKNKIK